MLNQKAINAVARSHFGKSFCKPLYDSYCFSRIPATIKYLLGQAGAADALPLDVLGGAVQEPYDLVILLFVDGFGWRFFEKYAPSYPFLNRFLHSGVASKITSLFPSTTAVHVTCMNTELDAGASGVYEWFYYEPKVDRIIAPLLFSFAGDHETETLKKASIDPANLYPPAPFYHTLKQGGVDSYVLQYEGIINSTYSRSMFQGTEQIAYSDLTDGLSKLAALCRRPRTRPAYLYFYLGDIDSVGHRHGIDSPQFEKVVRRTWESIEQQLWEQIKNPLKKTACCVVADHGMTAVDPKTTLYFNEVFPHLISSLKKNREGKVIAPSGSCRDLFLHVREEHLIAVMQELRASLTDICSIYTAEELIQEGLFGKMNPSKAFLEKVGNLVLLPFEGKSIWWREKHRFDQHFYAAHGGLTRSELETIFLFIEPVSKL